MTTLAPSRPKAWAISLPIPLAAPVMMTTLSSKRCMMILFIRVIQAAR